MRSPYYEKFEPNNAVNAQIQSYSKKFVKSDHLSEDEEMLNEV